MTDGYPHEHAGEPADPPTQPTAADLEDPRHDPGLQLVDVFTANESPELFTAPAWRLAGALAQLRAEADAANPRRDHGSDGTIGDAAHAARSSDHNPNAAGVVRALDLDVDGLDLPGAFERARQRVLAGQLPQLAGGYLILNRRITSPDFTRWTTYTGPNPHTSHGHISCARSAAAYDSRAAWGVFAPPAHAPRPPAPATGPGWTGPDLTGTRTGLRGDEGDNGPRVATLQRWLRGFAPRYAKNLTVDGWWGPRTRAALAEFGHRCGIRAADGRNIGPKLAAALVKYGYRG